MSDPTKDETYEGLRLTDFLRHFKPQMDKQLEEIKEINTKGFLPYKEKVNILNANTGKSELVDADTSKITSNTK